MFPSESVRLRVATAYPVGLVRVEDAWFPTFGARDPIALSAARAKVTSEVAAIGASRTVKTEPMPVAGATDWIVALVAVISAAAKPVTARLNVTVADMTAVELTEAALDEIVTVGPPAAVVFAFSPFSAN